FSLVSRSWIAFWFDNSGRGQCDGKGLGEHLEPDATPAVESGNVCVMVREGRLLACGSWRAPEPWCRSRRAKARRLRRTHVRRREPSPSATQSYARDRRPREFPVKRTRAHGGCLGTDRR